MSALLVVITGPPASGKTGPGRRLAGRIGAACLSKDDLKETLYDVLGHGPELEDALERASLELLYRLAAVQLDAGVPVVLESDFNAETDQAPLRELIEGRPVRVVQVHMSGDADRLVERFVERSESGERHPGHEDDAAAADDLRAKLEAGHWAPLDLPGELLEFDVAEKDEVPGEVARRLGR